ncbi:recombinase family protein [Enterobacter hormaechei]|uniref:recombinase family protein n=1 Tax=Enterobacter hormaechei TaxID=158836 RepID=UPI0039671730
MLRPICYERVSSLQQVSGGGGLDDQRSASDAYFAKNPDIFSTEVVYLQDAGTSAFRNDNISPGSVLGDFLEGIRKQEYGEGHALIVMSLDRISRRSSWSENTISFIVDNGIEIHSISDNLVLKRDDPHSKLIMELIQSRSHNESMMKSVRAKAAHERKVKEAISTGKIISKRMPVWLKDVDGKYAVNEEKAELIRSCFRLYANGMSTGEIVKHHKEHNLQMVTVSNWVRDRRLLGEYRQYNDVVYAGVYPAVIDEELFLTANRMMNRVGLEKKKPREDLLLDPELIRKIFRLYEEGTGTGAIVKELPEGWSTVNVLRVLREKKVVQDKIIDNLTFERVNQKLSLNGVANRIRKDLSIAQDDYITNLFPKILKCGCCGGNISIHYNHVRMKYVICRTREEKKECDAKSIQYLRIEKNILETVKKVDFQKLMLESTGQDSSPIDVLREELSELRAEEARYIQTIAERKKKRLIIRSQQSDALTSVQDRIDEVENELAQLMEVKEVPKLDFDMDAVLEPTNVELRAKVRKELRLVLKSIKYRVIAHVIFVQLEYFNDYLTHVLVINNKRGGGDLLTEFVIEQASNVRRYNTDSFSLTYTDGTDMPVFSTPDSRPISFVEYVLLRDYIREIEGEESLTLGWMNRNEQFIFQS